MDHSAAYYRHMYYRDIYIQEHGEEAKPSGGANLTKICAGGIVINDINSNDHHGKKSSDPTDNTHPIKCETPPPEKQYEDKFVNKNDNPLVVVTFTDYNEMYGDEHYIETISLKRYLMCICLDPTMEISREVGPSCWTEETLRTDWAVTWLHNCSDISPSDMDPHNNYYWSTDDLKDQPNYETIKSRVNKYIIAGEVVGQDLETYKGKPEKLLAEF